MITLAKEDARRFLLVYHRINGPAPLETDRDILDFIARVGCIQYDPLKPAARNADLVLQSRCRNYSAQTLVRLLYDERRLLDGWDKNMAIWSTEDWPYFRRGREAYRQKYRKRDRELAPARDVILEMIEENGHVSSKDIPIDRKVDWAWGPTRLARAALESMFHCGELVIHHKAGNRKFYSLAQRLLPASVLNRPDPNPTTADFHDWFVKRRIGSVGLMWNRASDAWLGTGIRSADRNRAIGRLTEKGEITQVKIAGIAAQFYLPTRDLDLLGTAPLPDRASLIAPLDNLMWDRNLILALFGFDYRWEVYTPVKKRRWGYYVLPVICGDRFVGRCEPVLDAKTKTLLVKNWWWEPDVVADGDCMAAVDQCLKRFSRFLGADNIRVARAAGF